MTALNHERKSAMGTLYVAAWCTPTHTELMLHTYEYTLSSQMGIPFWYAPIRKKAAPEIVHIILLHLIRSSFFFLTRFFIFCLLSFAVFVFFPLSSLALLCRSRHETAWQLTESLYAAFECTRCVCGCLRVLIRQLISLLLKWIVDLACLHSLFFLSFPCNRSS